MRRLRAKKSPKIAISERGFQKHFQKDRFFFIKIYEKEDGVIRRISIRDFTMQFLRTRNAEESAVTVGVEPSKAKIESLSMLKRKPVQTLIKASDEHLQPNDAAVRAGLERLAFSRSNDAAELVFSEEITPHMLAKADLYNVSEIKKVKGGGVEIKFFDRQKALEKLWEYNEILHSRENADMLARALSAEDDENDLSDDAPLGDDK